MPEAGLGETIDLVQQLRARITVLEAEVDAWKHEAETWQGIARRLAFRAAHAQLDTPTAQAILDRDELLARLDPEKTRRELRTEIGRQAIAKFVATALEALAKGEALTKDENGRYWRCRNDVIYNAAKIFGVSPRTIEKAAAQYSQDAFFTDGSKLRGPTAPD